MNDTLSSLKEIPLFLEVPDSDLNELITKLTTEEYPAGRVVFDAGDEGDCLYIISSGSMRIFINTEDGSDTVTLSLLTAGDYFGEMALITGEPRSASVSAAEDSVLLRLDKKQFDQLMIKNPKISVSISRMLSKRLKSSNKMHVEAERLYQERLASTGDLSKVPCAEILRFCEQNSLSGILKLESGESEANLSFKKGQIEKIDFEDFSETEALDTILAWEEGQFKIIPEIVHLDEVATSQDVESGPGASSDIQIMELFTQELLQALIGIVGSRTLQKTIEQVQRELIDFFPSLKTLRFSSLPECAADFSEVSEWTDKETLAIAVCLQGIKQKCDALCYGLSFLDTRQLIPDHTDRLNSLDLFEYMQHATELVA